MRSKVIAVLGLVLGGVLVGAASVPAANPDPLAQLEIGPGALIRGPVTLRRADGSIALRIATEVTFGEPISFH